MRQFFLINKNYNVFLNILLAALISTPFFGSVNAAARKCPVFDCLPYLLATDIGKISKLFNYESIIGITTKDDKGIEERQEIVREVCSSYMKFDNCFGGEWWECFDITELLQVAKEAFGYLHMPGGGDLQYLTEQQVVTGLKVASYVCSNWDTALNNSWCIRSSFVRNQSIFDYFVQAGSDMSNRPWTITCDRFKDLFRLFVYGLATNCDHTLANATNTLLGLGMQAIPSYNLSDCTFLTFEEIMENPPDVNILTTTKKPPANLTTTIKTLSNSSSTTLINVNTTIATIIGSTTVPAPASSTKQPLIVENSTLTPLITNSSSVPLLLGVLTSSTPATILTSTPVQVTTAISLTNNGTISPPAGVLSINVSTTMTVSSAGDANFSAITTKQLLPSSTTTMPRTVTEMAIRQGRKNGCDRTSRWQLITATFAIVLSSFAVNF